MTDASETPTTTVVVRVGRQPSTTRAELSHIALQLFLENGFDATTIDQIAARAGIGRRTVFRYFPSKNDLPWGDFDLLLDRMREHLASMPAELPVVDALHAAVVEFNRFPAEEVPYHRQRMDLLLNVPTLVAHSTLRYAAWRAVIASFVATRSGEPEESLRPQAIAWSYLAVSLSAYEQWLRNDDADLVQLLHEAVATLASTFDSTRGDG
ncbi:mycofactocin system transcriptional regulator [Herbiconiux sp. KACC 21604]|uniref:mycofactocin system transcriptional regulator n=1 Tax=unclassified Herbiconiux TaxID=2618217 RepID=UPI0020A41CD2|nr:mycofactocin system transcriptional regulator [Herbiconiux sp. SALV-R1]WPO88139.1 mycofactocin system transcriptional regulator [Herbiconiux sp. KACC 21604]